MPIDLPPLPDVASYERRASGIVARRPGLLIPAYKQSGVLPGLIPGPGMMVSGASAPLTSFAQQASATSTAATITWPSVAAGDVAILFDSPISSDAIPTSVTPSGFTLANTNSYNDNPEYYRWNYSYKVCSGTESGSLTGMNGTTSNRKILVTFRGDVPIASAIHGGAQDSISGANPSPITILSGSAAAPLIVLAGWRDLSNAINPRTFTPTKDGEISNSTSMYVAWLAQLTSPADVTIDMDDELQLNYMVGFYLQLST